MYRDIAHSCGHIERHLVGDYLTGADRKARQLARQRCRPCFAAEKEAQASIDREALQGVDLPALTGSEKQVAWAEKIRVERLVLVGRDHPGAVAAIVEIVEAKWWIDNRKVSPARLAGTIQAA